MHMRGWSGIALVPMLVIGTVLSPTAAMGQVALGQLVSPASKTGAKLSDGFYITPSLSIGELYDDNLFFSSTNRKEDFFTRISPGIQAGYQSTPLTVVGGYTSDSELYSKHQELNTFQMRQRALVDVTVRPTGLLTLSTKGSYATTRAPWEFNTFTGIALTRVRTELFELDSSIAYRLDPTTTARGDFEFERSTMVGFVSMNTYFGRLELDRRISKTDSVTGEYIGRRFRFFGSGTIISHAPRLGWKHEFSSLTTLMLRAGPRITEGSLDDRPEALASIEHRLPHGSVSLAYSNMLTAVVGQPVSVMAESVGLTVKYEPLPHLEISVAPTVVRATSDAFKATMYVSDVGLSYQLTKELELRGSHQFSLMRGNFNPATGPAGDTQDVYHNIFWLRLVMTFPARVN